MNNGSNKDRMNGVRRDLPSLPRFLDVYDCFRSSGAWQHASTFHGDNGNGLSCTDKAPLIHTGLPVETRLVESPLQHLVAGTSAQNKIEERGLV